MQKIVFTAVEVHTLGEPTRTITSGSPDTPGIIMMEKKEILEQRYDHLRRILMCESRGHRDTVGVPILPAEYTASAFGVVFMDAKRWANTYGHASTGCATYAMEAGLVPVCKSHIEVVMDTPSGTIYASVRVENKKAQEVILHNVPPSPFTDEVKVRVDGKEHRAAILFGDMFLALFDAVQFSLQLDAKDIEFLIPFTRKLLAQLNEQYEIRHPSSVVTRVVNAEYYVATGEKKQKNAIIVGEGQIDRSPRETGTSAKLAYLHAKGNLSADEIFVNEGFTGVKSYGRCEAENAIGHYRGTQPMITGSVYVMGKIVYMVGENDPLTYGFTI